MIIIISSSNG
ncbi:hypothetical protein F383_21293 [Gossypium arboreum]|uniref:Uncharacterized protein n=1 Tax=Gossypium arboreum TaxID=29729 RepID=A0A0B0MNP2_GOSAR|nr:hypothetical protein F383_21293 [Gossypium arboreum]